MKRTGDAAYRRTHGIPAVERAIDAIRRTQKLRGLHGRANTRIIHRDTRWEGAHREWIYQGGKRGIANGGKLDDCENPL